MHVARRFLALVCKVSLSVRVLLLIAILQSYLLHAGNPGYDLLMQPLSFDMLLYKFDHMCTKHA